MASPVLVLAEDDPDLRATLTEFLSGEGFRVLPASNGVAALRLLRHQPGPCRLLLDISMPVMDGLEVLQQLASEETFRRVKVVVFTAGPTCFAAMAGVKVLRKPCHPAMLLEALGVGDQRCA